MDNPKDGFPEDLITIAVPGGPPSSQWSCCCVKANITSISVSVLHALEAYLPPLDLFSLDCLNDQSSSRYEPLQSVRISPIRMLTSWGTSATISLATLLWTVALSIVLSLPNGSALIHRKVRWATFLIILLTVSRV